MPNHIAPFISPIDVLYLLHKTLRAEAARVAHLMGRVPV